MALNEWVRLRSLIRDVYRLLARYRFAWVLLPLAAMVFAGFGLAVLSLHLGRGFSRLALYLFVAALWCVGLLLAVFRHHARRPADRWDRIGLFRRSGRLILAAAVFGAMFGWPIWWFMHRLVR